MVSLFPELLSFGLLAPFILRLVIGFFFAFEAWELVARVRHHATTIARNNTSPDSPQTQSNNENPIENDPYRIAIGAADNESTEVLTTPASSDQPTISPWVRLFATIQFVTGGLLVIGAYTQGAAIAAMLLSFIMLRLAPHALYAPHERLVYKLLFFIAVSLLILGAGAFGFDYPL